MRIPRTNRRIPFRCRLPSSLALALILAGLLFAGGFAAGQEHGRLETRELERLALPVAGGVGVVTPVQVLAASPDSYLLVDVRTREAYDLSHATGAIALPESEMVDLIPTLPTDRTLVLYCTCPDEKTSLRAARTLAGVFHVDNVVVLQGGLDAFVAAGGMVSTVATDSAVEQQGCGCTTDPGAFKQWVISNAEQRADEEEVAE